MRIGGGERGGAFLNLILKVGEVFQTSIWVGLALILAEEVARAKSWRGDIVCLFRDSGDQ